MTSKDVDSLARKIWNYHHVNHKLEKADAIFVLCSHDLRVADYATKLFLESFAPIIIFSGGIAHQGDLVETPWKKPEAEMFAKRAIQLGVPKEKIIIENKAKNCGENVLFTDKISKDDVINIMVGDLQRIKIYPEKGFQIFQEISDDVWKAYQELVRLGYTKHLLRSE